MGSSMITSTGADDGEHGEHERRCQRLLIAVEAQSRLRSLDDDHDDGDDQRI